MTFDESSVYTCNSTIACGLFADPYIIFATGSELKAYDGINVRSFKPHQHKHRITSMARSGKYIVTIARSDNPCVWKDGQLVYEYPDHEEGRIVTACDASIRSLFNDGNVVDTRPAFITCTDRMIRIWTTEGTYWTFPTHARVSACAAHPDMVLSFYYACDHSQWLYHSGSEAIYTNDQPTAVAISDIFYAWGTKHGEVCVEWRDKLGYRNLTHRHTGPVTALIFSSNELVLVSGGADGYVYVWRLIHPDDKNGKYFGGVCDYNELWQCRNSAASGGIQSLSFTTGGLCLMAATSNGLRTWKTYSLKHRPDIYNWEHIMTSGHRYAVRTPELKARFEQELQDRLGNWYTALIPDVLRLVMAFMPLSTYEEDYKTTYVSLTGH